MPRRRLASLIAAILIAAPVAAPAAADPLPAVGQVVSGRLTLFDKPIPLPAGKWHVASTGFGPVAGAEPGPYGTVGGALLVPAEPDSNGMFLIVHTNALPVRDGWGVGSVCKGPDHLFSAVAEPRDRHDACSFVMVQRRPLRLAAGLPALTGPGATAAGLPSWALVGGFQVSDRRDFVDMRLGIAPRHPNPAGWFKDKDALDGTRQDMVRQFADWLRGARTAVAVAIRSPAEQVAPLPVPVLGPGAGGIETAPEDTSLLARTPFGFGSFRVLNSAVSLALASYVSGSLVTGGWVALWQGTARSALFLAGELAWGWQNSQRVIDLASAPAAHARPAPAAGSPTNRPAAFPLDGKLVPLPQGDWVTLAQDRNSGIGSVVLGRIEDKVLKALVIARTNLAPTRQIVAAAADCGRNDMYFRIVRMATPDDGYCAWSKRVVPSEPATEDPLWGAALQRLRAEKVELPVTFLMVGARPRTRENFLDLRYYFAGDAGAMMPRARAAADPSMQTRIDGLRAWADLIEDPALFGLRGQAAAGRQALPPPWPVEAVDKALITQSHDPIEAMRAIGALDDAGFQRQITLADRATLQREQERWSFWTPSMYKETSDRMLDYVDIVTTSWAVTGSFDQSVTLANMHAVIRPVVALASGARPTTSATEAPQAAPLSTDFPEIGVDRQ